MVQQHTQESYLKEITSFYWENGQNPDISLLQRLAFFAELVVEKNEAINLISRKDIESIIENHVFISSYIAQYIPEKCEKFLDLGTGGGFPGIPLAIMNPMLNGVLVDSITKKTDAVAEFIEKLRLKNISVVNARVESPEFIEKNREQFDLIVSRATVPLIMLIKYALPLIKKKAFIMAIKGGNLDNEFTTAQVKYSTHIKKITTYELHYKPTNLKNIKEKKLIVVELNK